MVSEQQLLPTQDFDSTLTKRFVLQALQNGCEVIEDLKTHDAYLLKDKEVLPISPDLHRELFQHAYFFSVRESAAFRAFRISERGTFYLSISGLKSGSL